MNTNDIIMTIAHFIVGVITFLTVKTIAIHLI
jgi:hypothetical protein